MSEQLELFREEVMPDARRGRPADKSEPAVIGGPFDPIHSCIVCSSAYAPFGRHDHDGYRFYCPEHRQAR